MHKVMVQHADEEFLWFLKPLKDIKLPLKSTKKVKRKNEKCFGIYCTRLQCLNLSHHQQGTATGILYCCCGPATTTQCCCRLRGSAR